MSLPFDITTEIKRSLIMKKWIILFSAGFLLMGEASGAQSIQKLYVSPKGNDNWSGIKKKPLATLETAKLKIREILKKKPSSPIEIQIRGGEYLLDKTILFGPKDSGTSKAPITYKAQPGEKPVFSGAKKITQWKKCTSDPTGTSPAAKGKLWMADIPKNLRGKWPVKTLYNGLKMLQRSTSEELRTSDVEFPQDYNLQVKKVIDLIPPDHAPVVYSREFHFQNNDLKNWKNIKDIEIFWSPLRGWLINMLPLDRIDVNSKTAWFGVDPTYHYKPGNIYQVKNAIEYLDKPGEWVFNSLEGRIYIWPEQPLKDSDIRAPYLQEFIRVEGIEDGTKARYISFEGLTFHHGLRETWKEGDKGLQHDWDMYDKGNAIIRFRHAEHCSVSKCEFTSSSGAGIRMDLYCQKIKISDNLLAHLGGTGILLSGYAPGTKDENKYNKVTNNYIHHVGRIYQHSPGIFIAQSGHNKITHNTIHDQNYNGIVVSGCRPHEFVMHKVVPQRRAWVNSLRINECLPYIEKALKQEKLSIDPFTPLIHSRKNLITMNEIHNIMQRLHDGNAIYFSCMGSSNRVEYNYCHDNVKVAGTIRLDDNCSFTVLNNNVIQDCKKGFVLKQECELKNNFLIDIDSIMQGHVNVEKNVIYHQDEKSKDAGGYYIYEKMKKDKNNKNAKRGRKKTPVPFHKTFASIKDVAAKANNTIYHYHHSKGHRNR